MTVCAEKLFPGGKIGDEGVGKGEKRGSDRGCDREARRAAEAPGVLEFGESRASCRSDQWGRTKLDFFSGKPLDDYHRSAALRARIKIKIRMKIRGVFEGEGVL